MARIREQKGRLYISATLPHKDGSPGNAQAMITLQLPAGPRYWKQAEKKLKQLERELEKGTFEWANWIPEKKAQAAGITWEKAINLLYEDKVTFGTTQETTWQVSYMSRFKNYSLHKSLTTSELQKAIEVYERHTCSYQHVYYQMKRISELTGVPFPRLGTPLYNRQEKDDYEVPSDSEVIDIVQSVGEEYRWHFGMMAAYGLRPHETDRVKQIAGGKVQIHHLTKRGYRTVIPVHADWPALFRLDEVVKRPPSINDGKRRDTTAMWMTRRRRALGIPYVPYALRHAYAHRLWREGGAELDIFDAAKLMGHSIKEHVRTYRRAIDPNKIAKAAEEAIERNLQKKRESLARNYSADLDSQSSLNSING